MASGNRVEELESRVNELQATVDGLTDELVECKVRIRELENVVDSEVGLDAVDAPTSSNTTKSAEPKSAEPDVETTDAAEPAEATKSEAPEGQDNTESDENDIIIA